MSNIYGLIGEKLSHSFSPKIHEAFFEKTGIDVPREVNKYWLDDIGKLFI